MKLAFIREPGHGQRQAPESYPVQGWALEMQLHWAPEQVQGPNATRWTPNGTFRPDPLPVRPANVQSFFATSPAAWQSGWSPTWEHISARPVLVQQMYTSPFNPSLMGRKELGPAMVYQAGPSLGQVAPKAI